MKHTIKNQRKAGKMIGALGIIAASLALTGCLPKLDTRTPPAETAAKAPDFALTDTAGKTHELSEMIADGPAVVVFYRGYW